MTRLDIEGKEPRSIKSKAVPVEGNVLISMEVAIFVEIEIVLE